MKTDLKGRLSMERPIVIPETERVKESKAVIRRAFPPLSCYLRESGDPSNSLLCKVEFIPAFVGMTSKGGMAILTFDFFTSSKAGIHDQSAPDAATWISALADMTASRRASSLSLEG